MSSMVLPEAPSKSRQEQDETHRHHPVRRRSAMKSGVDAARDSPQESSPQESSSSSSSRECSVSFEETVTVRWHATVLGDHPGAKRGPPVSLDWKVVATDELPLRNSANDNNNGGDDDDDDGQGSRRSSRRMMKLSTEDRIKRVRKAGFSVEDIHLTIAECRAVRNQRKDTVISLYENYHNPFDAEDDDNDDVDVDCTVATTTASREGSSDNNSCSAQTGRKRSVPSPSTKSLRRTERGGMLAATMAAAFRKHQQQQPPTRPIIDPSSSPPAAAGANEKFGNSFFAPKKVLPRSLLCGIKKSIRVKKKAVQRRWLSPKVVPVE